MTKKVIRRGRRLPDRRLIHPDREWLIGLGIFVILLTAGTVYEVRNFMTYGSLEDTVETESLEKVEYDRNKAVEALESFSDKATIFNSTRERYSGVFAEPTGEDSLDNDEVENEADRTVEVEPSLN